MKHRCSVGWPRSKGKTGERWQKSRADFPKAKVLNRERGRFDIGGGDYRLIASVKFKNRIVFVKFIGRHAYYDRVDALTVSLY